MIKSRTFTAALALALGAGAAQAAFQGRLVDGTASTTCTVSGPDKCAMFYNTTLDITILNDWNIGDGEWSATAAAGSAQALAESAGAAQTAFTGWFLPTGNGSEPAGPLNQVRSIWNELGGSFTNQIAPFQAQFDGVQDYYYWSRSFFDTTEGDAWFFNPGGPFGEQGGGGQSSRFFAVAVRPGDVISAVPEPHPLVLALLGLGVTVVASRRRSR